jgi:membrane-anchored protein YejM (alkaline phosphatase superfamily)
VKGLFVVLILCGLTACGCPADSPGPTPEATPPPAPKVAGEAPADLPDILILVLDTTGTKVVQEEMPATRTFLESSRRFTRAVAPCNSTMETVAGVMTGTWMSNARLWERGLVTLSEALSQRGYHGFIGTANPVLDHPFYARGFERTHLRMQDIRPDFPDLGLVEAFEAAWSELEQPRLAWLQLAACHDYRIAGKDYIDQGWASGAEGLAEAWQAYKLDCRATDELMPRLLAANPDGITIVTSDHGELFAQHGSYGLPSQSEHGHGISDSPMELMVPLGIRGPGFEPGVVDEPVSLLDIRSTLFRVAGIEGPGGDLRSGEGLTPAIAAACDVYDRQTSNISVRVRPDGTHVVRSDGLGDVPALLSWQPEGVGRRPHRELSLSELDVLETQLLFSDAKLPCLTDRDLCRQNPEVASLGYIDCAGQ